MVDAVQNKRRFPGVRPKAHSREKPQVARCYFQRGADGRRAVWPANRLRTIIPAVARLTRKSGNDVVKILRI